MEDTAMSWQDRIELNPDILAGKPIVAGTRLAVQLIVELLADGMSEDELVDEYPGLTPEDIKACLRYASERLEAEKVYPLRA